MSGGTRSFNDGAILGVLVTRLVEHTDARGSLTELFRLDTLPPQVSPSMGYMSLTEPGIARGPHEHVEQTDVFAFVGPGSFVVHLWDDRATSPTRGCRMVLRAGAEAPTCVVVPPGVVHAYRNVSPDQRGMVLNFPDKLYAGWGRKGPVDEVRHEDRADQFFEDFVSVWSGS